MLNLILRFKCFGKFEISTSVPLEGLLLTERSVQFAHKTIKPEADQLLKIYNAWKIAVDEISDVEGLVPTFVMNVLPKSALSVAKNNGIGNTWGLDDDQSYIRKSLMFLLAHEITQAKDSPLTCKYSMAILNRLGQRRRRPPNNQLGQQTAGLLASREPSLESVL